MNSYTEIRRVRAEMSRAAGHDVRRLIAMINKQREDSLEQIIDPGSDAEHADSSKSVSAPATSQSPN